MTWQIVISLTVIVVCTILLFINPKAHLRGLLKKQLHIFYDVRKGKRKIYWFDLISFLLCPTVLSLAIVLGLKIVLSTESIGILLTIFSIFFSIIFSSFSFLSGINTDKKLEKRVVNETTIVLFTESELSMFEIIVLLINYFLTSTESSEIKIEEWILITTSILCVFIAFLNLTLLLIVIKRVFVIKLSVQSLSG